MKEKRYTKRELEAIDSKFDAFWKFIKKRVRAKDTLGEEVLFVSLDDDGWRRMFTARRTELMRAIASGKARTVGALAAQTGRPREAVSRDLSYLEGLRVIRMQRNGKERIPVINKKLIVAAVPTYLS